jgi:pSer/pThr/pTyr-binding forkhead associated (FHA) protein
MSDESRWFWEACGATGPLSLACEADALPERQVITLELPAAIVGRDPDAEVTIDLPRIERRQAYLQVVEGRLFVVGLELKEPVRWDGVPRPAGWLEHGRPIRIGPATIMLLEGGEAPVDRGLAVGPGPLSRRYASKEPLPCVLLKFRGPGDLRQAVELDRPLALVGRSERCQIRLDDPGVSRLAASMVRTPAGLWIVDLLSRRRIRVNGHHCRQARLEDGDLVDLGTWSMRVFLGARLPAPASPAGPLALAPTPRSFPPSSSMAGYELPDESALGALLDRGEPPPGMASSPFGQALMMLVQLLGDVHRDHLELVRSELEQIRRLGQEIRTAQAQGEPNVGPHPAVAATNGVETPDRLALEQGEPAESPGRPDPSVVHDLISDRLASWERERQSRWRKVLELLVRS